MNVEETVQQFGWFEKLKTQFSLANISTTLNEYKETILEIALYSGIGFLAGFLLKKYSSYIAVFILYVIGLIALYQMDILVVVINWDKVYELLGIQSAAILDDTILNLVWAFIKANVLISASFFVGFLIGFRFA